MRCFVTGLTGFVGGYLAGYLASHGAEVLGIGLTMAPPKTPFETVQCDLLNIDELRQLITSFRPEYIYHLAALSNPSDSLKRPLEYYQVNLQGTLNLLEVTREHSSNTKLLLVSSCQVYGKTSDELLNEDFPIRPQNPYASSKWLSERAALQYQENFGTRVVISRPFNHSGPGQSESFVVSSFCKQIATIEKEASHSTKKSGVIFVGNLRSTLDFLDVRDVVRAYVDLAVKGAEGEVYNVCSGTPTEIQQILDLVRELSQVKIEVQVSRDRLRNGGTDRLVGDNQKLQLSSEWSPRYTLHQMVADTLNGWRSEIHKGILTPGVPPHFPFCDCGVSPRGTRVSLPMRILVICDVWFPQTTGGAGRVV